MALLTKKKMAMKEVRRTQEMSPKVSSHIDVGTAATLIPVQPPEHPKPQDGTETKAADLPAGNP